MWQQLMVVLAVACATLYLAWRWMPAGWRQRLRSLHNPSAASQAPASASGCGSCSGCGGGCSTPAPKSPR